MCLVCNPKLLEIGDQHAQDGENQGQDHVDHGSFQKTDEMEAVVFVAFCSVAAGDDDKARSDPAKNEPIQDE